MSTPSCSSTPQAVAVGLRTPPARRKNKRFRSLSPTSRELNRLARGDEEERQEDLTRAQFLESPIPLSSESPTVRIQVLRAKLMRKGFKNVSENKFQSLQPVSIRMRLTGRCFRSSVTTVESCLADFLPAEVHRMFFSQCNLHLALHRERQRDNRVTGHTISSVYRELTWSEYWLFWGTHLFSCVNGSKSIDKIFACCTDVQRDRLLSQNRFCTVKASMYIDDLQKLSHLLSKIWCSKVTLPEVICVDESLWKFLASFLGKNASMVVSIPRKPAKCGVLSYEACCIMPDTGLCYVLAVSPRPIGGISPKDALIDCLSSIREYCESGRLPTVVADSAFSSTETLAWMHANGFAFIVSGNTAWHPAEHQVCASGLSLYCHRTIRGPDKYLYTAYKTAYTATGGVTKKVVEQDVFSITNCYAPIKSPATTAFPAPHPPVEPSESLVGDDVSDPDSEVSESILAVKRTCARSLAHQPHDLLLKWASEGRVILIDPETTNLQLACLINKLDPRELEVEEDTPQASTSGVRKKNAASSNSQHLVNTTPHSSITIGNRVVKREEILNLTLMNLKTLLKEAQPQVPTSGWNKERAIRALWDIHSAENDGVLARQMELFCKLIPSATDRPTLDAALPFIYQYRRHFASVDRLDQFLAYLDTNIRTTRPLVCISERFFMCGISNAHTWFCEDFRRKSRRTAHSDLKPAAEWGAAVMEHFFSASRSGLEL